MIREILFGVAVGDALGVPVEFKSREHLLREPLTDMIGFGTHRQPAGTFSDDSSLTFCQAEALIADYSPEKLASFFLDWLFNNYWTPWGRVFDKGMVTENALKRIRAGVDPLLAGGTGEFDNGNGSLMRILPLLPYIKDMTAEQRFHYTKDSSSLTHAHIRSVICCYYYLEFAREIASGTDKFDAYIQTNVQVQEFLVSTAVSPGEMAFLNKIWSGTIQTLDAEEISGSGYVVHSLEASLWCLLTTNSYRDAVLKAINLGIDTDTTGSITGGLAGLLYGFEQIPTAWVNMLARKTDIHDLANRLENALHKP